MPTKINEEKRKRWEMLITEQEKSDLSQSAFCKKYNVPASNFAYYRRLLRREEGKKSSGTFSPVTVSKRENTGEIRVILPNGFQCGFPLTLESMRIKELVRIFLSC